MTAAHGSSLKKVQMSFVYAARGLKALLASQQNTRIHLLALVVNVALGFSLVISRFDWGLACCAMALVWMAEAQNTATDPLSQFETW